MVYTLNILQFCQSYLNKAEKNKTWENIAQVCCIVYGHALLKHYVQIIFLDSTMFKIQ